MKVIGEADSIGDLRPGETGQGRLVVSVARSEKQSTFRIPVEAYDVRPSVAPAEKEFTLPYHWLSPTMVLSYRINDGNTPDSRGNSDGLIQQGEVVEFGVALTNHGETYASGVRASLSTEVAGIVFTRDSVLIGRIDTGATSQPASFLFTVQRSTKPGLLPLKLTITQDDFDAVEQIINLNVLEEGIAQIRLERALPKVGDRIWVKVGLEDAGMIWDIVRDPTNPDIVYAATELKGVLKSTDGGLDWVSASAGLKEDFIRCLAIDPMKSSTLYAGSNSKGVFKTVTGRPTG